MFIFYPVCFEFIVMMTNIFSHKSHKHKIFCNDCGIRAFQKSTALNYKVILERMVRRKYVVCGFIKRYIFTFVFRHHHFEVKKDFFLSSQG